MPINFNSFTFGCVFYLSNIMWIYIILVFILCLFTLKPQFQYGLLHSKKPKVTSHRQDNIQELVMLPMAPSVSLVKH